MPVLNHIESADRQRNGQRYIVWRAVRYDKTHKRLRKGAWTTDLDQAKRDRERLAQDIEDERLGLYTSTLRDAAEDFLKAIEEGSGRNRSGDLYKPSVVDSYRRSLDNYVLPVLGHHRLTRLRRHHVQALVDDLSTRLAAGTVRNAVNPVRALYRWALVRNYVEHNPCAGLAMPAVRSEERTIVTAPMAHQMTAALPDSDRLFWTLAFFCGLRLGELVALTFQDCDLMHGVIHVTKSYDTKAKKVGPPKSRAGNRKVPMTPVVKAALEANMGTGLVFPGNRSEYLSTRVLYNRAKTAWKGTFPVLTPHDARHCYASYLIRSGIDLKACSSYLGHASISITVDRYGHLMADSASEDAARLASLTG